MAPLLAACSEPARPRALEIPPFVFVAHDAGIAAIHRYDAGTITRLSSGAADEREPHSAAGRIVFTSRRDGNAEIYIADLALSNQRRITASTATDEAPALHPAGTTIAFVSDRSGAPRLWLADADGTNLRALETGSPTWVPEGGPAWSPDGERIAFTSTRTSTSQLFVVSANGGAAVQLSTEATGAFNPTWSGDGRSILYVSAGGPLIMRVAASGGNASPFATDDEGLGDPACRAALCLAVLGAFGTDGDVIAIGADGRMRVPVLVRAADDRQPALIVR